MNSSVRTVARCPLIAGTSSAAPRGSGKRGSDSTIVSPFQNSFALPSRVTSPTAPPDRSIPTFPANTRMPSAVIALGQCSGVAAGGSVSGHLRIQIALKSFPIWVMVAKFGGSTATTVRTTPAAHPLTLTSTATRALGRTAVADSASCDSMLCSFRWPASVRYLAGALLASCGALSDKTVAHCGASGCNEAAPAGDAGPARAPTMPASRAPVFPSENACPGALEVMRRRHPQPTAETPCRDCDWFARLPVGIGRCSCSPGIHWRLALGQSSLQLSPEFSVDSYRKPDSRCPTGRRTRHRLVQVRTLRTR
jgi:hypothetical protein